MVRLLAIPNDETRAYERSDSEDFLSEFNPYNSNHERYFESVKFLNIKDYLDTSYSGIESISFLENNKIRFNQILGNLSSGLIEYSSPMFESLFEQEIDNVIGRIKEYSPDIIRAFNTHFAAELGNVLKKRLNVPLVVSAHDPSRLTSAIEYSDNLVCISNELANNCVSRYNVNKDDITIIPDGVDMDRLFYPRDSLSSVVMTEDHFFAPKILSVGRIVPSKNIETLLESLNLFKEDFPNFYHYHIGNGSDESIKKMRNLVSELNLQDNSFFLGPVQKSSLPEYYSWADVYCLPTLWEGLGRAQIESLSCGTPVITTNKPPMNEIVSEGFNGFLIDPNDSNDISEKLKTVFKDRSLREYLSQNSRDSVKKYSVNRVMKLNSENYDNVLRKFSRKVNNET